MREACRRTVPERFHGRNSDLMVVVVEKGEGGRGRGSDLYQPWADQVKILSIYSAKSATSAPDRLGRSVERASPGLGISRGLPPADYCDFVTLLLLAPSKCCHGRENQSQIHEMPQLLDSKSPYPRMSIRPRYTSCATKKEKAGAPPFEYGLHSLSSS